MYVSDFFCVKISQSPPKWLIDQTYLVDVGASELVWWAQVRLVPIHYFQTWKSYSSFSMDSSRLFLQMWL